MNNPFISTTFPFNSPTFYYVRIGLDGKYTYVNELFQQSFGHISSNFIGQESTKMSVHPDDIPLCEMVTECLENPKKVVSITIRKKNARGNYSHTHWNFFTEIINGETQIGSIGFDVSEFVEQSGEHKMAIQKLDAILNSTHESFYLLDTHMKVLSFSQGARNAARDFFGFDMHEGFDFTKTLLPSTIKDFTEQFNNALAGKKSFKEEKLVFPNGKEIWSRLTVAPAHNEVGETFGVTLSFVNIDMLKKSEMQLKEIAWQQSHNVRKPLSNILGLVELMKDEMDYGKMQELYTMLKTSAAELDERIKEIVLRTAL